MDERERLEELVERPESAGHDDIPCGVFHEHHLACEEMFEVKCLFLVPVRSLFLGKLDVEPDRESGPTPGSTVRRFHDPFPSPGDDGISLAREGFRHLAGGLVRPVAPFRAGAAEYGDGRADGAEGFEPLDELAHDAEHAPRLDSRKLLHVSPSYDRNNFV